MGISPGFRHAQPGNWEQLTAQLSKWFGWGPRECWDLPVSEITWWLERANEQAAAQAAAQVAAQKGGR
ncbi:GpE family phage tail protein [Lichenicola cladoniae]|uniref:GpE family phage tail protein n=1 Tax=Lichenicola cladoniae TaxID=1484109 RepID=A0A6M8HVE0_9PROT|nr:GpE family phage tail protein [Acetobacteraceae bacterium]QKE92493.1 GpE family phage tail protein [Lichenicola cladoniae]